MGRRRRTSDDVAHAACGRRAGDVRAAACAGRPPAAQSIPRKPRDRSQKHPVARPSHPSGHTPRKPEGVSAKQAKRRKSTGLLTAWTRACATVWSYIPMSPPLDDLEMSYRGKEGHRLGQPQLRVHGDQLQLRLQLPQRRMGGRRPDRGPHRHHERVRGHPALLPGGVRGVEGLHHRKRRHRLLPPRHERQAHGRFSAPPGDAGVPRGQVRRGREDGRRGQQGMGAALRLGRVALHPPLHVRNRRRHRRETR